MSDSITHLVTETLKQAAEGLLFPSETDAPLEPFFWPQENNSPLNADMVTSLAGVAADIPIKSTKLATFFRPATKAEEWHNEEERAQAARFQELVKTLKDTLDDVNVFRVGETRIDVYVVGKVEGGYAGLKTLVVET